MTIRTGQGSRSGQDGRIEECSHIEPDSRTGGCTHTEPDSRAWKCSRTREYSHTMEYSCLEQGSSTGKGGNRTDNSRDGSSDSSKAGPAEEPVD